MNLTPKMLDHSARNVVRAFNGCLLLPVRPGVDPNSVPLPVAPEAHAPEYRAKLGTHSIAVVLGPRSGGLFVVRLNSEAELQAFLARNPESRHTLITRHAGHHFVWLRVEVPHRASLHLPGLAVLMVGNELVLDRGGLDRKDVILNSATPAVVNVEQLDWGPDATGAVDVWLTTLFQGELFRRCKRGHLVARPAAWRYLLARQLRNTVVYEIREHQFYQAAGDGKWQPLDDDRLLGVLRRRIAEIPVEGDGMKSLLTDDFVKRLIRRLQTFLAAKLPVAEGQLREYAQRHLRLEPGNNITTAEIYLDYVADCRLHGLTPLALTTFRRMIVRVLAQEPWLKPKSNSIPRASGHQHGFRGLRLKESKREVVADFAVNGTRGIEFAGRKCAPTTILNDRGGQRMETCVHAN